MDSSKKGCNNADSGEILLFGSFYNIYFNKSTISFEQLLR